MEFIIEHLEVETQVLDISTRDDHPYSRYADGPKVVKLKLRSVGPVDIEEIARAVNSGNITRVIIG